MDASAEAVKVASTRACAMWKNDQRWHYKVGFDHQGEACRLEISGGFEHGLGLAWRTVNGQWLGRFRYDDGFLTAHLSSLDIELVKNIADSLAD